MPIIYRIIPEQKISYIKAWGKISVDEIILEGARMFSEKEWENGFNILCDYREIIEVISKSEDIMEIVEHDKKNEPIFNKSKCAIVAKSDLIFGLSRMWEILSEDTKLTKMVFRDIKDAKRWLGLSLDSLDSIYKLP